MTPDIQTEILVMETLRSHPGIKAPGIARMVGRKQGYIEKLLTSLALDDCVFRRGDRWYLVKGEN